MEKAHNENIPINIPDFYKGKSVFITGFTGSIGKLIVEKLLFSCPEINKIYALVRDKKGQNSNERVKEVLCSKAFNRVRERYPGILESKIVPIAGDVGKNEFGMSKEDQELLKREVSIVFHGAASVRFDDPLKLALKQNTLGTMTIAEMALDMVKLEALVYISTAYTNCENLYIKEELYPPKADWRETKKICEVIDDRTLNILTTKYINFVPNTYVFTKSLSEHIISEYRDRLPVVIVRPSIVVPAVKEPIPGWTDNKYGPSALVMGFLFGIVRCSWVDVTQKCNYIYSDVVINAIIVASWKTALTYNPKIVPDTVVMYNVCSPLEFNMDHEEFSLIYTKSETLDIIRRDKIDCVQLMFVKNELWYRINILIRHVIPAAIIDLALRLLNKSPILLTIRRKVFIATTALSYFTMRTFEFEIDRFNNLRNYLKPEDKEAFTWNWDEQDHYSHYNKIYLLAKDSLLKPLYDDLDTNRKRLHALYFVDRSVVYLSYCLPIYLIYAFSIPQLLCSFLNGLIYF